MSVAHWLRRVALLLLALVLTFAAVTAKTLAEGERQMRASEDAFDAGRLQDALVCARRAATLYVPGAPHVDAAYARLAAIAVGAEAAGQVGVARQAWEAMRAAAFETRHVWVPHGDELDRANHNLARLAVLPENSGDRDAARQRAAQALAEETAPRVAWVFVLGIGFALAAFGLAFLALRGVTSDGRLAVGRVRWAVVVTLVGVACWTIAVYKA
jgi:hypothetical protein